MSLAFAIILTLMLLFVFVCSFCWLERQYFRAGIAGTLCAECVILLNSGWI